MRIEKIGNATLYEGDCLALMAKLPDASVDMILCDPPYGTTACKWDSVIDLPLMWEQLKRIIKPNGAIVLFGSEPFSSALRCSNLEMFKYDLVWEKSKGSNFVHSKYQPLKTHENIIVFSKGGAAQGSRTPMKYYPQMTVGVPYDKGFGHNKLNTLNGGLSKASSIHLKNETGNRFPRSVHYYKTAESEGSYHPTQKPVALMEYLIRTYTNEGETVLDNCMGSGTTGVACANTGRQFIGMELDETYFNTSCKRLRDAFDLHDV